MYTQLYVKDVWLLCYLILFPKSLSILLCTWKFVALHACESLKSLDSIFECKLATKQFFVFDILYSQLLFLSVQLNIEEMLEAIIYLIQKQRYVLAEYFAAFSLWFQFDLSRSWDLLVLSHSVKLDCLFKY
jgi:hypothetical protein